MEWRPIPSAPGYEASNCGQIRDADGDLLKQTPVPDGYLSVCIRHPHPVGGRRWRNRFVGGLVCEAFHGPRPEGHEADHRNRVRDDNEESNLRWLPSEVNQALRAVPRGDNHPSAKLTAEQVVFARSIYRPGRRGCGSIALANRFKVSQSAMHSALTGRTWRDL